MTGTDRRESRIPNLASGIRTDRAPGAHVELRASRGARGFTLVELLVALGLFAVTTGLIADLFLAASRQQARTTAATRLQSDARLILETIARELRDGSLEYEVDVPANTLALRGANGARIRFERIPAGDLMRPCPPETSACLSIGRGGTEPIAWAPLTGVGVRVDAFAFRTAPAVDPFAWNATENRFAADEQPRLTVYLRLAMAHHGQTSPSTLEAQTTVVSRVYRR